MRLLDLTTSTTGVVIATYETADVIAKGSFACESPAPEEVARCRDLD